MRGDSSSPSPNQVLTKRRLQNLLHEIDPREQMDDDVEDVSSKVIFFVQWEGWWWVGSWERKSSNCVEAITLQTFLAWEV